MQTNFTLAQLADADVAESEKILRTCVHCGFCLATCPTYLLTGDELDGPRGRIYLVKDMLESGAPASDTVARHIDRCLSCLSCMTTCPSGVNYMHLVDHARRHIEDTHLRPLPDRLLRRLLAAVLPFPGRFRLSLHLAQLARPFAGLLPGRLKTLVALAPPHVPPASPADRPQVFPAEGKRRARVALLSGCAQQVLKPEINAATVRLLTRHGVEVVVSPGMGCCGSLTHHLGQEGAALAFARANIDAWCREMDGAGLDAIIANASGCGTTLKDYGFMLRQDPAWSAKAAKVAALARDVTEVMAEIGLAPRVPNLDLGILRPGGSGTQVVESSGLLIPEIRNEFLGQDTKASQSIRVAYHSACSMQHGQKLHRPPRALLEAAGFEVAEVPEAHLCCGSAGTYNILQPEFAEPLRQRKIGNIRSTGAAAVATGNIGCIQQLESGLGLPILHTVELLDWATGGPKPAGLTP